MNWADLSDDEDFEIVQKQPKKQQTPFIQLNESGKPKLKIIVQKNHKDLVIVCKLMDSKKERFVNINRINNYTCIIHRNDLKLALDYFNDPDRMKFRSPHEDEMSDLDKIVIVDLVQRRIIKYYLDLIEDIAENLETIKEELEKNRNRLYQSLYDLVISGFKYNLANYSFYKESLYELFSILERS